MAQHLLPFLVLFAVGAAVLLLATTQRRRKFSLTAGGVTGTAAASRSARSWLKERSQKLNALLADLHALKTKLASKSLWRPEDEARLIKVEEECQDYLESAATKLSENFRNYCQLFQEGPLTTVPESPGSWSMPWYVWMVDAHLELLTILARSRLQLSEATDESTAERLKSFITEVETAIDKAGFNRGDTRLFPRFRMENIVRQATGMPLVLFPETPFGLSAEEAVNLVRVAARLPDIRAYINIQMPVDQIQESVERYGHDKDGAWRNLTEGERAAVLATLREQPSVS